LRSCPAGAGSWSPSSTPRPAGIPSAWRETRRPRAACSSSVSHPLPRKPVPRIALVPGDGIGTEVLREARRVLEAAAPADLALELSDWSRLGAERWLRERVSITDEEFRSLAEDHDAVLLGALGDPRVPGNEHA